MALPDNVLSSQYIEGGFLEPDNLTTGRLEDWERGGKGLSDTSEGVDYQDWYLSYDRETGIVTATPQTTGSPQTLFTLTGITDLNFTFDQNMHPFVCYYTDADEAWYWWWDPIPVGQVFVEMASGVGIPRCCLDDKRPSQVSASDILLVYTLNGNLYYREQRDRFTVEYLLREGVSGDVHRVGMGDNLRVKFDVGGGITVGQVVQDLCHFVGITNSDTTQIDDIPIRGFLAANPYSASDTIRVLQAGYFFDFPEIDGRLVAILRGGSTVATISRADMVMGEEAEYESAREQGVEFPQKLHLNYSNAETDYTPTKATSERRSKDIKSLTETSVEIPVNYETQEATEVVDKMHKTAWTEMEGTVKFAIPEKWARLVASNPVNVEVDPGVYKRVRIQKITQVDGVLQVVGVNDRIANASSHVVGQPYVPPSEPPSNLTVATTYEVMDLPALLQTHDTLHVYISAFGDGIWTGATVQQLIDTEWIDKGEVTYPETMGQNVEVFNSHARGYDTTNTLLVNLSDDAVASITQTEFDAGGNAALIGDEIINFKDVAAEGDYFRLSNINRAQMNTNSATHAIGTRFVMLTSPTLIPIQASFVNQNVTLRVVSFGTTPTVDDETTFQFFGRSQIEWPPLNPTASLVDGDWLIDWDHNKRIGAPNETVESVHFTGFQVQLIDSGISITLDIPVDSLTYTNAEQLVDFGGAVSSFEAIYIWGVNEYTGNGGIAGV